MEGHAYKQVTAQQLRSFCETARRGSLSAAATALGLAQPTVWKQVHALEKAYGVKLVEPHARLHSHRRRPAAPRARLPVPGQPRHARRGAEAARQQADVSIHVAASPRFLGEDLVPAPPPSCDAVRTSASSFTSCRWTRSPLPWTTAAPYRLHPVGLESRPAFRLLSFEPWYHLDVLLITPRNHPLAAAARALADLKPYSLLASPQILRELPGPTLSSTSASTDRRGHRGPASQRHPPLRRAGFRHRAAAGLAGQVSHPRCERPMTQYFGRSTVHLVRGPACSSIP